MNKKHKDSEKLAWYGVLGMVILLILVSLLMGCTTTKKCCDKEHNQSYGSERTN